MIYLYFGGGLLFLTILHVSKTGRQRIQYIQGGPKSKPLSNDKKSF